MKGWNVALIIVIFLIIAGLASVQSIAYPSDDQHIQEFPYKHYNYRKRSKTVL